jgi:hypothetical protein
LALFDVAVDAARANPKEFRTNVMAEELPTMEHLAKAIAAPDEDAQRQKPLPPVELWRPPFCGDIDMRIARDGAWFYQGTLIGRPALVRLFSTILRKDPERYVLVTPVERVGITVEDAPFVAVEMDVMGESSTQVLRFRTNVDDWVKVDAAHPLRFEPAEADGIKPYVLVRGGLWAVVKRALWLDLVALGEIREHDGLQRFGVVSSEAFFPLAKADEINAIEASL